MNTNTFKKYIKAFNRLNEGERMKLYNKKGSGSRVFTKTVTKGIQSIELDGIYYHIYCNDRPLGTYIPLSKLVYVDFKPKTISKTEKQTTLI